jgi:hypothetical protein
MTRLRTVESAKEGHVEDVAQDGEGDEHDQERSDEDDDVARYLGVGFVLDEPLGQGHDALVKPACQEEADEQADDRGDFADEPVVEASEEQDDQNESENEIELVDRQSAHDRLLGKGRFGAKGGTTNMQGVLGAQGGRSFRL